MCINSFELYGNFHTVPEPEYYGAISGHRGGIDERQPKLFIKLSNNKRATPYVLNEALYDFLLL